MICLSNCRKVKSLSVFLFQKCHVATENEVLAHALLYRMV